MKYYSSSNIILLIFFPLVIKKCKNHAKFMGYSNPGGRLVLAHGP